MFESHVPFMTPAGSRDTHPAQGGSESLVRLQWDVLVARLGAARELRAALGAVHAEARSREASHADGQIDNASFDARSARHLHALADGKQAFNLEVSADGKPVRARTFATQPAARTGQSQTGEARN